MAVILGCLILAILIYGQDIAYFLNENSPEIPPIQYLTVLTIISLFFFLSSLFLTYLLYKKKRVKWEKYGLLFSIPFVIGFLTSWWSIFVLAMWWG